MKMFKTKSYVMCHFSTNSKIKEKFRAISYRVQPKKVHILIRVIFLDKTLFRKKNINGNDGVRNPHPLTSSPSFISSLSSSILSRGDIFRIFHALSCPNTPMCVPSIVHRLMVRSTLHERMSHSSSLKYFIMSTVEMASSWACHSSTHTEKKRWCFI